MTPETPNSLLEKAKRLTVELVGGPAVLARDIPHHQGKAPSATDPIPPKAAGVYLIRETNGDVIYAGKATNLWHRICGCHLSAGQRDGKDFRDKLAIRWGLTLGVGFFRRLCESCSVAWVEIADPEMRTLVERLLVAWLRAEKEPLLNK